MVRAIWLASWSALLGGLKIQLMIECFIGNIGGRVAAVGRRAEWPSERQSGKRRLARSSAFPEGGDQFTPWC